MHSMRGHSGNNGNRHHNKSHSTMSSQSVPMIPRFSPKEIVLYNGIEAEVKQQHNDGRVEITYPLSSYIMQRSRAIVPCHSLQVNMSQKCTYCLYMIRIFAYRRKAGEVTLDRDIHSLHCPIQTIMDNNNKVIVDHHNDLNSNSNHKIIKIYHRIMHSCRAKPSHQSK